MRKEKLHFKVSHVNTDKTLLPTWLWLKKIENTDFVHTMDKKWMKYRVYTYVYRVHTYIHIYVLLTEWIVWMDIKSHKSWQVFHFFLAKGLTIMIVKETHTKRKTHWNLFGTKYIKCTYIVRTFFPLFFLLFFSHFTNRGCYSPLLFFSDS